MVLLGALLTLVAPTWALPILKLSTLSMDLIWMALSKAEANFEPLLSTSTVNVITVMLALLGLFWMFAPRGWPVRPAGLLLCLPLFLPLMTSSNQNRLAHGEHDGLEITVLDVGQGLSVVLRSAEYVLVYDAGPAYPGGFDAGAMVLVPFLQGSGVKQVDRYLQSHGDLDHRGGADALRTALPVHQEIGTTQGAPCNHVAPWVWEGAEFEILHPINDGWEGNNASCVLRVQLGPTVLLLTGDIEKSAEAELLRSSRGKLGADILVVPHHGSDTSSGPGLLNAVMPSIAIVSAGWRNRWGFPKPLVVRRYAARDIKLLNTASEGAITLRIHPQHGLQEVTAYRRDQRRFWHAD